MLSLPWFPTNASKQAGNIRTLYDVLLIVTIPIFVLVVTVVGFSVVKFRMRPGEEDKDGPPIHGNTRLEVIWTAAPVVLILGLCIYSYTVLRANEDSHKGETLVNVTERQFAFEFSYPVANGQQVVSPVLYLADDHPYLFHIRSLDVIHSFFVPDFSEKIDAVPGITTDLRVTPTQLGMYPAECTELCGPGHSFMRAPVRVVTPAAFATWLKSQKPNGPPPVGVPPPNAAESGEPGAASGAANSSSGQSSSASQLDASSSTSATAESSTPSGDPEQLVVVRGQRRRREGRVHRRRWLLGLPHARLSRGDWDGRPEPRHAAPFGLCPAGGFRRRSAADDAADEATASTPGDVLKPLCLHAHRGGASRGT